MLSYTPSPKERRALGLGPPGHCSTLQSTATNVQTDNLAQQEKVNCVYSVLGSILFPLSACPHSELQGGPPAATGVGLPSLSQAGGGPTLTSLLTLPWIRRRDVASTALGTQHRRIYQSVPDMQTQQ